MSDSADLCAFVHLLILEIPIHFRAQYHVNDVKI